MTIAAVAVLQTIARDEFERGWNGYEEPLEFIDGYPWDAEDHPPVTEIIVELGGKSYVFPPQSVVATIKHWEEVYRYEVEDEEEEDEGTFDWSADRDGQIEEKVWAKVHDHFFAQLDNADEAAVVIQHRCDYLVKGFQELVAYTEMVGERIPTLRPVLAERLKAVYDYTAAYFQEWVGQQGGEHEDEV